MKLKTIPVKAKPKAGDIKEYRRFAWWPIKVGDKLIWLEYYIVVCKFIIRERIHDFRQYGIMKVNGGGCDVIEEKLLQIPESKKPVGDKLQGCFATIIGKSSDHRFDIGTQVVVMAQNDTGAYVKESSCAQTEFVLFKDLRDDTI